MAPPRPPSGRPGRPERPSRPSPPARGAGRSAGSRPPKASESQGPRPPKQWGNVARRGARSLERTPADDAGRKTEERDRGRPAAWQPEEWVQEPAPPAGRRPATGTGTPRSPRPARSGDGGSSPPRGGDREQRRRGTAPPAPVPAPATPAGPGRRRKAPQGVAEEIGRAVGPGGSARIERRLVDAASAFERDRTPDALRILRPLAREAPGVPAVRELTGLALYRAGRWAEAARHLEAFRDLTGSVEQHPVLADCYRALNRFAKVDALWEELRAASPEPALLTEGRIVVAGSLADRGDIGGAIRLLERGPLVPKRSPAAHHLRLWYALADLAERAGDTPRARELFRRVVAVEPGLADVAERLHALG